MMHAGANLRTLVRLGFHDCVSNSSLCDGCIDLQDSENNGLADAVNTLNPICNTHAIGLADCWAAAASIATEELSGGAVVPMFFGRADAASCGPFNGGPEGLFPSGEDGPLPLADASVLLLLPCQACYASLYAVHLNDSTFIRRSPQVKPGSYIKLAHACLQGSTRQWRTWHRH